MKKSKLLIVLLLLLTLLLSMTLFACKKDKDPENTEPPVDVAPVEYATADAIYKTIVESLDLSDSYHFGNNYPSSDGVEGFEDLLPIAVYNDFSAEVASKNFPAAKLASLSNVLNATAGSASNPYELLLDFIDACNDSDLTAEEAVIVFTAYYNGYSNNLSKTDIFDDVTAQATKYINDINTKYAAAEDAEVLNYIKNAATYKYVNDYIDGDGNGDYFELLKDRNLSEAQYNHLRPMFNSLKANLMPEYTVAVAEVEEIVNDSAPTYNLWKYALDAFRDELIKPTQPAGAFAEELAYFTAVSDFANELTRGNWMVTFKMAGYTVANEEAYEYIDYIFNGVPANPTLGQEAIEGYKDVCPNTKAVLPTDYTGLNRDWYNKFTAAIEADEDAAQKDINEVAWYSGAFAFLKYFESSEKAPLATFGDDLDKAVLDVIQPLTEAIFNFGGAYSTIKGIFDTKDAGELNTSDILAMVDSLNVSLDEFNAFIVDNGEKLTTLATALRNNSFNGLIKNDFIVSARNWADVVDSFVGAGPEFIKLMKAFVTAIDEDLINSTKAAVKSFDANWDALLRYEAEGDACYLFYIPVSKLFDNVFTNENFNSAEEVKATIANIGAGLKGSAFGAFAEFVADDTISSDYSYLLEAYYDAFEVDATNKEACDRWLTSIEYLAADGDLSSATAAYLTTYEDGNYSVIAKTFAEGKADVLEVLELLRPAIEKNMNKTVAESFVKPLFENSVTYDLYDEEGVTIGQETKTSLELLSALANAAPIKNIYDFRGDWTNEMNALDDRCTAFSAAGNDLLSGLLHMISSDYAPRLAMSALDTSEDDTITVEAKFEKDSTESKKIFLQEDDTVEIIFTCTAVSNARLELHTLSNSPSTTLSNIKFYVVTGDGEYERDSDYGMSMTFDSYDKTTYFVAGTAAGYFTFEPGFKYMIRCNVEADCMVTLVYDPLVAPR